MFTEWVQQGGNLIAMRPDPNSLGLLGLSSAGGILGNGYLPSIPSTGAGAGIVGETIQFHGTADRYTHRRRGVDRHPLLRREHRNRQPGGDAAQRRLQRRPGRRLHLRPGPVGRLHPAGQPGLGRTGARRRSRRSAPTTSSSAPKPATRSPTGSNLDKVAIPQADEQQRLLANLIGQMNLDRKPLPRFWFLPRDEKAAVVMTGDDHGNGGTAGRFEQLKSRQPPGCSVADWECVRGDLLHLSEHADLQRRRRRRYQEQGFEIGLHITTNCEDWTSRAAARIASTRPARRIGRELPEPGRAADQPHPLHRLERLGDPAEGRAPERHPARHELLLLAARSGSRTGPGCSPGSGMPMRFADLDGTMIDVYQAATQMTDESDQTLPVHDQYAARQRARDRRATTASSPPTCTPTTRPRRARKRSSPPRRHAACRSSRHARC